IAHRLPDLVVVRSRIATEQAHGGGDLTGRAIAALEPELLEEPLLHRVQPAIVGQSFDRRHRPAGDAAEGRDARSHGLIIDQQRAAAADALEAAVPRAAETELVADGPEQAGVGIGCQVAWIAIDDEPG